MSFSVIAPKLTICGMNPWSLVPASLDDALFDEGFHMRHTSQTWLSLDDNSESLIDDRDLRETLQIRLLCTTL